MATGSVHDASPAGITREEARALEEDFHGRLRGKLGALREVFNPLDGRAYFVDPASRPREWDEAELVKRTMLESGVLDRSVRRRMPTNRTMRLDVGVKGFLSGFKARVAVAGISLSPLKALALEERTAAPVAFADLEEAVKRAADRPKVFHYVGVFATTAFSPECMENPPCSRHLQTLLVERGADSEWIVRNDEALPWNGAAGLFDLETIAEKVDRCRRRILGHPELRMKGGHVALEDLRAELVLPEDVFERGLAAVLEGEEAFQVREIDGVRIVQRSRF